MGARRTRWYQVGIRQPRLNQGDSWTDPGVENPQAPPPTARQLSAPHCDGAMVARSQIHVSDSTATLLGTLTNETGCDVYFSGMPPYASTLDIDGSQPILIGDFNSPPRAQPYSGAWVMHPVASVPYRSLPVTMRNPDSTWEGTDWCTSSQSTTLDIQTFSNQRDLPTIHLFN